MTDALSRIVGPTNTTGTVFTGVTGHTYTIKYIRIVNGTTGSISVGIGIGGTGAANQILPPTAIGAGESAEFDGVLTVAGATGATGADTIQMTSGSSGATITISAMDQS
jgi:hypothetical protein